jgi:hypothetical protein
MTYLGSCRIAGQSLLCTSMSASLDQRVLFFDHILGLQDKIVPASGTVGTIKGEVTSGGSTLLNVQKTTYRYSPAIAKASVSAPVPADSGVFGAILEKAIHGDELDGSNAVEMTFWKKDAPRVVISKARIASLSIDLKAGEIVRFSFEVVGARYVQDTATSREIDCDKLLTWDRCEVEATPVTHDISSFTLSINNPTIPIYTANWTDDEYTNGMMPQKIRVGMQEVSGTIGVYGPTPILVPSVGTVRFRLNDVEKEMNVAFVQPKDDASGGVYVRTIAFNGVSDGSVWSA